MLVATGYWPPQIPFEEADLTTVLHILKEQNKKR